MRRKIILLLLLASMALNGCAMQPLYKVPDRPEEHANLQAAITGAMSGLEYFAPKEGKNQQSVQMADLNGDGVDEALLFARSTDLKELKFLVFSQEGEQYQLTETLPVTGSEFELVEYVPMDQEPGLEIVIGHRLSDQVERTATVYGSRDGKLQELLNTNYRKLLTCDLNSDGSSELFVLRNLDNNSEISPGVAVWYRYAETAFESSPEVNMSQPVDNLNRVMLSKLDGGVPGVYVASTVAEDQIITDVYALLNEGLVNVASSNEAGTSVETLRNKKLYGEDIDGDGVMELPELVLEPVRGSAEEIPGRQPIINWYAMTVNGTKKHKEYTYHNIEQGWYINTENIVDGQLVVTQAENNAIAFNYYSNDNTYPKKRIELAKVLMLTGDNRFEEAAKKNRIILGKTGTAVYVVEPYEAATNNYGFDIESLNDRFHLISRVWEAGES